MFRELFESNMVDRDKWDKFDKEFEKIMKKYEFKWGNTDRTTLAAQGFSGGSIRDQRVTGFVHPNSSYFFDYYVVEDYPKLVLPVYFGAKVTNADGNVNKYIKTKSLKKIESWARMLSKGKVPRELQTL